MKLKVMHIIPSLAKGGAERIVLDICNNLSLRKDCIVKLIVLSDLNEYKFLTNNIDYTVCKANITLSIFRKKNIINIGDLIKIIKTFNPDIIHSHLYESELVSREITFNKISYISHLHNNIKELSNIKIDSLFSKKNLIYFWEKQRIIKKYKQCNNCFIAISKDTYNFAYNVLPKSLHNNIILLPNAIDTKRFNKFLIKDKIFNNPIQLITIGSLTSNKNHRFLIYTIKELLNYNFDIKLYIIGNGSEFYNLKVLIKKLELEHNIYLTGKVNSVEDYLKKSDIYVHTAIKEAFGLTILEAMATGLPCISLDGDGNKDLIINDFNGYLLDKYTSYKDFAKKIITLITDIEKYKKLSNQAIDFASKYDINIYGDNLMKIYKKILKLNP